MIAKVGAPANDTNIFEPPSDWVHEEECDTLNIYLPGYSKEQLRVQLARSGILKISGTRQLEDGKWTSFVKEFTVSPNCDTNKISAKFEGGILSVKQPKLIVPAKKDQQAIAPPDKPTQPPPRTDQEQAATPDKTTPSEDQKRHTTSEKEEQESTKEKEEKKSETEDAKKDAHEKTDTVDPGRAKVLDEKKARKRKDLDVTAKLDYAKLLGESPAAKLKMARQKITMVLAIVFAFALGIYISNRGWFSRKA